MRALRNGDHVCPRSAPARGGRSNSAQSSGRRCWRGNRRVSGLLAARAAAGARPQPMVASPRCGLPRQAGRRRRTPRPRPGPAAARRRIAPEHVTIAGRRRAPRRRRCSPGTRCRGSGWSPWCSSLAAAVPALLGSAPWPCGRPRRARRRRCSRGVRRVERALDPLVGAPRPQLGLRQPRPRLRRVRRSPARSSSSRVRGRRAPPPACSPRSSAPSSSGRSRARSSRGSTPTTSASRACARRSATGTRSRCSATSRCRSGSGSRRGRARASAACCSCTRGSLAILLAFSRGGVLVAVVVVAVWLAVDERRLESAGALVARGRAGGGSSRSRLRCSTGSPTTGRAPRCGRTTAAVFGALVVGAAVVVGAIAWAAAGRVDAARGAAPRLEPP